jgi:PPP family 3-phenylpropionic acid transporter
MWALGVIAEVVLFLFMHRLIAVFGLRKLLLLSLFSAGVRWLLIALFIDKLVILGFAQLLHAATFGICHAVAIQYIHKYFTGKLQGRGQGLYSSASFGAGFALGSLLTGYAWESIGATACFTVASVSAFLAMGIAWVFVKD